MKKRELGDFQTPTVLADSLVSLLKNKKISPEIIIEPTCGKGSILLSAYNQFKTKKALGIEIQKEYADCLNNIVDKNITILNKDFFVSLSNIKDFISDNEHILFVGNPPWITNSELSILESSNLPQKNNFDNIRGIEAITGKSNFDISEYIIKLLIDNFSCKKSVYAFLCKISVAKKIMNRLWKNNFDYNEAEIYPIDSKKYFSAAVDACLFYLDCTEKYSNSELTIFESLENPITKYTSGFYKNIYFEDLSKKDSLEIYGKSPFIWRNGVKHDCSKVMELTVNNEKLQNGYKEFLDIEDDLIFPFLKSSDLAKEKITENKRILITQKFINEPTDYIQTNYPKTWKYLIDHTEDFEKRKSIIYKNKCKYSIFSVGDYSFKPYKVAISGLYKSLNFKLISPYANKTVLLDDTCNFISFNTYEEAEFVLSLLKSDIAEQYLNARISWESKRPIKTELLNSIDFEKLAKVNNKEQLYYKLFGKPVIQNLLFA
jgi:hypothetical protein